MGLSQREEQLRWGGGGRQQARGERGAELEEPGLGLLAGGVEALDGAAAATGAAQHVGAEGALVKRGPVEAGPLWVSEEEEAPSAEKHRASALVAGANG